MAEEWVKNACSEARAAFDAQSEVEVELSALKENHSKMAEQLKEAVRARDSAEVSLKTTEMQFEDIQKQLHYTEINMATEKQLVMELREELCKAKEAAQLFKEVAEAEKRAAYTFGVKETQARLTEEFSAVARDYCDISWGKAIYVAGVLADSGLRRAESIYYNPKIRELSDPSSSLPEQAAQVFEVPKVDQVPLAPLKLQWTPTKILAKEKRLKLSRVRIRARTKKRILPNLPRMHQTLLSLSPSKLLTQGLPRQRLRLGVFIFYSVFIIFF